MKKINKALYDALEALWKGHADNGGKLKYAEKDRECISDTLDLIDVKYFNRPADGDRQMEIYAEGTPNLTDLEAYTELITRFQNANLTWYLT